MKDCFLYPFSYKKLSNRMGSVHKHKTVKDWLAKNPRFHIHSIPTSSSWLNMIERFFGKITEERIKRGAFKSVPDLIKAIESYINEHNKNPKPFIWTKSAEEIINKLAPIYKMQYNLMN